MIHEFTEVEWYTISGRKVASVIWRGPEIDKATTDLVEFFRHVKITGKDYTVVGVESYAIQRVRTGDPISFMVETALEAAFRSAPKRDS